MPTCIYCLKTDIDAKFSNEHVISRAISGSGENWTLINLVCKGCNKIFSTYEGHMFQQSIEALSRAMTGPAGRNGPVNGYVDPMKINHLYVIETGDELVYEGGLSLPGKFYFRPQLIQETDKSFSCLLTNHVDKQRFSKALSDLFSGRTDALTIKKIDGEYLVAPLESHDNIFRLGEKKLRTRPSSCWLRNYPDKQRVPAGKKMTPRLAIREDGTSFIRANSEVDAIEFINSVLLQGEISSRPDTGPPSPGGQEFVFLHTIDGNKVMVTVLKTGINLLCHFFGERIARASNFDYTRSLVLSDPLPPADLRSVCSFTVDETDFPAPLKEDAQHRFMIDVYRNHVRLRMRLYGNLVYTAILGIVVPDGPALSTKRVVLDFSGTGLREVSAWT